MGTRPAGPTGHVDRRRAVAAPGHHPPTSQIRGPSRGRRRSGDGSGDGRACIRTVHAWGLVAGRASGGAGLRLSEVDAITYADGGSVGLSSRPGANESIVTLPLGTEAPAERGDEIPPQDDKDRQPTARWEGWTAYE